ncbi:MAG TPA: SDR family NAD(P)-dependent oxidoreductase [Casimicrobiaceae bacterium]|jgi:3-oxoacyl-[acyl-carrier protein] reductase|nr:SDR family NAD(P)-dependent oxidoreductase [Casimicrobiaceae bacterium]
MKLAGRTALVTGASSGIGAAIAEALAAEGANVTINYFRNEDGAREVAARVSAAGRDALTVQADVRRKSEVTRLVDAHLSRFGRLDILVNNAGDMVKRVPTAETSEETWRDAIDLNLSSAFYCSQLAIAPMRAQRWGRIVNISSVGARTGGGAGSIPYHAAKAAVMAMTKALAKELAQDHVTVNTVAPGIIDTGFHDRHTRPEQRDEWIRMLVPMQRAGLPREVATVVAFLASEDASYMTGSTVDVNGGMAMY